MREYNEDLRFFVAVGPRCWGRGYTRRSAVAACRENYSKRGPAECTVYKSDTPDIYVDGMGAVRAHHPDPDTKPMLEEVGTYPLTIPLPGKDDPLAAEFADLYAVMWLFDELDRDHMIEDLHTSPENLVYVAEQLDEIAEMLRESRLLKPRHIREKLKEEL